MSYAVKLTDTEVRMIASDVLGREMRDLAFESVDVRAGTDHDDSPSLFVTANVGPGVPLLTGDAFGRIHGALHEALLERGEERFPHFRVHRVDDVVIQDDMILSDP